MSIFDNISEFISGETRPLGQWLNDVQNASPWNLQDYAFKSKYGCDWGAIIEELNKTEAGQEVLKQVFTVAQKRDFIESLESSLGLFKTPEAKTNSIVNTLIETNKPVLELNNQEVNIDVKVEQFVVEQNLDTEIYTDSNGLRCERSQNANGGTYTRCRPFADGEEAAQNLTADKLEQARIAAEQAEAAQKGRIAAANKLFASFTQCAEGDLEHQQVLAEKLAAEKLAAALAAKIEVIKGCSTGVVVNDECVAELPHGFGATHFAANMVKDGTDSFCTLTKTGDMACYDVDAAKTIQKLQPCFATLNYECQPKSDAVVAMFNNVVPGTDQLCRVEDGFCTPIDKDATLNAVESQGYDISGLSGWGGALGLAGLAGLGWVGNKIWSWLRSEKPVETLQTPVRPEKTVSGVANSNPEAKQADHRVDEVDHVNDEQNINEVGGDEGQAERERAERERAEREQAEREQAEREQAEREQAEQRAAEERRRQEALLNQQRLEQQRAEEQRRLEATKPQTEQKPANTRIIDPLKIRVHG